MLIVTVPVIVQTVMVIVTVMTNSKIDDAFNSSMMKVSADGCRA